MNHRFHPRWAILLLLLTAVAHAAPARADPTPADRNVARSMTIHARDKLKAGDPKTALKLFQAAHALMGSPVTGLDWAKAQVALGLLVEARDTALDVTRIPVSPGESKGVKDARSAAVQLAVDLADRIPALAIHVQGLREGVTASIRVDETDILASALAPSRMTNPGEHTVKVSANGYIAEQRRVTLKEGQVLVVDFTLSPAAPVAPPPCQAAEPAVPPRLPAVSPSPPAAQADQGSGRSVPGWAWDVGAAGLTALGLSVGFAVDHVSVRRAPWEALPVPALRAPFAGDRGRRTGML